MLGARPGLLVGTPLKQRKTGEPEELPLRFVDLVEGFAEYEAKLTGDEGGGLGAFDFGFRRHGDNEVARLRFAGLR